MRLLKFTFSFFLITTILFSCNDDEGIDDSMATSFDIFSVQADRTTVVMNGEIKNRTLDDFNDMLQQHPNINLINMGDVPGSNDDEINFQVGVILRQKEINTHILDDSEIASGGVDFFLAGRVRTRGNGTKLGVHAWSDDNGNEATDFPIDSDEHTPNINYYEDLGYTPQWASDFYFFTINAAAANEIHLMTEAELSQYEIFN